MLVSRPYSPEIQVFIGDGQGSFAQGQAITLPGGGIDPGLKPDGTLSYFWSTSRFPASGFYRVQNGWAYDLNFPNDAHEIFAFGAEPRSFALGASTRVAGFFSGQELNLETTFEFGRTHNFHSKQFRSTIALQWEFWKQVRLNFELNQ